MITCKCHCGKEFQARAADVRRGWARSCSKSCAAVARERKLDRFDFRSGGNRPGQDPNDDPSWGEHEIWSDSFR